MKEGKYVKDDFSNEFCKPTGMSRNFHVCKIDGCDWLPCGPPVEFPVAHSVLHLFLKVPT